MSLNVAALRVMADKGLSLDDILEIAEAMEVRSSGAERQKRYRDRQRGDGDVTRDVTDRDVTQPPILDKESVPQTPFKEIKPTPRTSRASAHGEFLPVGWKPATFGQTTISGEIIARRGQDWAKRAFETFENHWRAATGKTARKGDWQATWANWVIEQDRRDGQQRTRSTANDTSDGLGRTARASLAAFPDATLGRSIEGIAARIG